jgi:2-keto-myo-inositol isomerase
VINSLKSKKLKIVHDTFHHALANEHDFFPSLTGLVHFSGISNKYNNIELKDDHRSIVENNDIISNLNQMKTLVNSDYKGYFSFEPFSNTLINDSDIFKIVRNSLNFISSNI